MHTTTFFALIILYCVASVGGKMSSNPGMPLDVALKNRKKKSFTKIFLTTINMSV